jgi:DNA modification methylase
MKQETQMFCGDSAVELLKIKDNSVDMLCSDPPYAYGFMGKKWDQVLPDTEIWRQSYRVLKPGAFITIMAAPRTDVLWRISRDLEEAGFDLSFTNIEWVYHSGFPKATDVSKSLDKRLGADREVIGKKEGERYKYDFDSPFRDDAPGLGSGDAATLTAPSTDVAKKYEGSKAGFQPKPAREIIIVGMKPFSDGSYVDKVLNFEALPDNVKMTYPLIQTPKPAKKEKNINVEKYLVWENEELTQELTELNEHLKDISVDMMSQVEEQEWNIISFGNNITEQSLKDYKFIISIISKMIIELKTLNSSPLSITKDYTLDVIRMINKNGLNLVDYVGNISQLKLNTTNEKLEYLLGAVSVVLPTLLRIKEKGRIGNIHSTVKPIKLMSYLITLFTRPDDWILDPFGGSGTTGLACKLLDRNHIYIDFTEEYYDIAQERLQVSKEDLKKLLKEKISNGQQELF